MADYVTHIKPAPGTESVPVQDANAVQRTGDTMSADLSMGGFRLTDVGEPELDTDAANKKYVDEMLPKAGGTMSGPINMGSKQITNLADPTNDSDAVTKKYVDDAYPKWVLLNVLDKDNTSYADTFTDKYDELLFMYDSSGNRSGHTAFDGAASLHVPTACLSETAGYFGVQYSSNIRFGMKLTDTLAEVYAATYGGSNTELYKIYIFGR